MTIAHRILIVEDNPDDEVLLMRQLKKADMHEHVKVIDSGDKALAYLMDERYPCKDLLAVFLDLKLPKISGLKLLEAIRSDERIRHLPVIVLTSSNDPKHLERCSELGVSSFVQKPLTFASFAKAFADTFHAQREARYAHAAKVEYPKLKPARQ